MLDRCQGNRQQAAQILGLSPTTLWRKLKAWERADVPDGIAPPTSGS